MAVVWPSYVTHFGEKVCIASGFLTNQCLISFTESPVINPRVRLLINKVDLKSYSFSKPLTPSSRNIPAYQSEETEQEVGLS